MELSQLLGELKVSVQKDAPVSKLLHEIARLDKGWQANLSKIGDRLTKLDAMLEQTETELPIRSHILDWAGPYRQQVERDQEQQIARFGRELEQAILPQGIQLLRGDGRLIAGLFTIELDPDHDQVLIWYGSKHERLTKCPMIADRVANRIAGYLRELESALEPDVFLAKLQQTYFEMTHGRRGQDVAIVALLGRLAWNLQDARFFEDSRQEYYHGYSRAAFSYDLYRFRGFLVDHHVKLRIAVKEFAQYRKDYLWVPSDDSGQGYRYSHLQFVETTA